MNFQPSRWIGARTWRNIVRLGPPPARPRPTLPHLRGGGREGGSRGVFGHRPVHDREGAAAARPHQRTEFFGGGPASGEFDGVERAGGGERGMLAVADPVAPHLRDRGGGGAATAVLRAQR